MIKYKTDIGYLFQVIGNTLATLERSFSNVEAKVLPVIERMVI